MVKAGNAKEGPYGSAQDLPSVREAMEMITSMKALTLVVARSERPELKELERKMKELVDLVDHFYNVLGERHWIFHDSPSTDLVADALDTQDVDEAERRFISIYRDPDYFKWRLPRLRKHEGIRFRLHQLEMAVKHYQADEFDSCTLQLIAVMDGFVNDFDIQNRKGLHARDADEMVAWDSVVGHHMGLTNVMPVFNKTIKKRVDEEIFEVHRNGIVHGSTPNFDNVVVATKAWNLFFAVVDWAEATEIAAQPEKPKPTLNESLSTWQDNQRMKEEMAEFAPSTLCVGDDGFEDDEIVQLTKSFFGAWNSENWGRVRDFVQFRKAIRTSHGALAGELKDRFSFFDLEDFEVLDVAHQGPVIWIARGTATVRGDSGSFECRWVREDEAGKAALPSRAGSPRLVFCDPTVFKKKPYVPLTVD